MQHPSEQNPCLGDTVSFSVSADGTGPLAYQWQKDGVNLADSERVDMFKALGASEWTIFRKLRLPNALPYLFNALKVAIVLAVVSVIVAEFLIPGPPNGLGQRISLSAHRGQFDIVFAAILVSSVISMLLYWTVQFIERWLTAWHPSSRGS